MIEYLRILLNARFASTEERGASAVEYGLLIAGIAALVAVTVFLFSDTIIGLFDDTTTAVNNPAPAAP